jgi:GTPase
MKNLINKEETKINKADLDQNLPTNYDHPSAVKLSIIGNVDSGKSTLVGVLTKGIIDDGRGSARLRISNIANEIETGRTSSVGQEIIGYDSDGNQVLPDRFNINKNKYWTEIVKKSNKIVTLLDLCGHEKYLKTTLFGMVGLCPDYSMIVVASNMGISKMTKEHLGITLSLKVPFFIVLTKTDMCPSNVLKDTVDSLNKILKSKLVNKYPIMVKNINESQKCAEALADTQKLCPIFPVSNVTGEGIKELLLFINLLKQRNTQNTFDTLGSPADSVLDPFEYHIHENFMITGFGLVVSGLIKSGTVSIGQTVMLGPDKTKNYRAVVIKSIHVTRVPVDHATVGQFACFGFKPMKAQEKICREDIRKGMVMLDARLKPTTAREFLAEVSILHHSTTVKSGYIAMMHCGVIRQAVCIQDMNTEVLRTNDKGIVRFRFVYNNEYIKQGEPFILREGRSKIMGVITKILDEGEDVDLCKF